MSRKYEYRTWDGHKMISPDYISRGGIAYWQENSVTEKSAILMQSTGLSDKNGKEIYEGDIIEATNNRVFPVSWDSKEAQFTAETPFFYLDTTSWNKYEVIGNIHQNKDLLDE